MNIVMDNNIPNITRPMVRYPGGKFRIAKWLVSHYVPHGFYVAAYAGSLSDVFQKPKSKSEIINDLNKDIVNVYRVLRNPVQAERLENLMRLTPFSFTEYEEAYEPTDDVVEWARRVIYRSFATIGTDGIFRKNAGFRGLKNRENFLTTAHEWNNYFDCIPLFRERLKDVIIENRPAIQVIKTYDTKDTLVYADPPYMKSTRRRKRDLYAVEMGDSPEEEIRLHEELADTLNSIRGVAIVSYYDHPLYDKWYKGWRKESIAARKMGNSPVRECICIHPRMKLQERMF